MTPTAAGGWRSTRLCRATSDPASGPHGEGSAEYRAPLFASHGAEPGRLADACRDATLLPALPPPRDHAANPRPCTPDDMRHKPSPDDTRFWSQAEGGVGFNRNGKPRYQYSALRMSDKSAISADPVNALPSIVASYADSSPDTVRAKARAALLLAVRRVSDTLADESNELRLTELSPVIASLGRISGVADDVERDTAIAIHIVRDAPSLPPSSDAAMLAQPRAPYALARAAHDAHDAHADAGGGGTVVGFGEPEA